MVYLSPSKPPMYHLGQLFQPHKQDFFNQYQLNSEHFEFSWPTVKIPFSKSFRKPVVKDQCMFVGIDIDMVLITFNDCIQKPDYFPLCIEHIISEYDSYLPKNLQCNAFSSLKGYFSSIKFKKYLCHKWFS